MDDRDPGTATPLRDRRMYFRELFRLQGDLVELQNGVPATWQKVVILLECRDAAGKGGVIERVTQRLDPRVARVARGVALPAQNSRRREACTVAKEAMLEHTHLAQAAVRGMACTLRHAVHARLRPACRPD